MQFSSVEVLEAENAFQCRRCWKLLNPGLVAQVGRRRAVRVIEAQVKQQTRAHAEKHVWLDDASEDPAIKAGFPNLNKDTRPSMREGNDSTPRPSYRMKSGYADDGVSAFSMDRHLLAAQKHQEVQITPSATSEGKKPEIMLTESSPKSDGSREGGTSGFSELNRSSSNPSDELASSRASITAASAADCSDGGAEADEEDPELSASEAELGTLGALRSHRKNTLKSVGQGSVTFANQASPDFSAASAGSDTFGEKTLPLPSRNPALPPRAQRYLSRRAHKRYLISSLPPILVLHLKRFQQTSKSTLFGSFNNLKKLDDKVSFPLSLDMSPFIAPPPIQPGQSNVEKVLRGEDQDAARRGRKESDTNRSHWFRRPSPSADMRAKCQYQLYGVISHDGNMTSGHYVVHSQSRPFGRVAGLADYVWSTVYTSQRSAGNANKNEIAESGMTKSDHDAPRQWIYCSDDLVRPATLSEVMRTQAYCLLYERVDASVGAKL